MLGTGVALAIGRARDHVPLETGAGDNPDRHHLPRRDTAFGWMRQPVPSIATHPDAGALLDALGLDSSRLPVEVCDNGVRHLSVALPDEAPLPLSPPTSRR